MKHLANKKILLFDIETSPNLAYVWGKWEQNVIEFKQEWELLSFAYKWLGSKEVYCTTRRDFTDKTDKAIVKSLWKLLDEAEVVIAHNGDSFDHKKARAKFVAHGLTPPAPYQTIDTKKIAKSNFQFNSNSLDDLGRTLGVGRKEKTGGFDLWLGCMAGDKKSWDKMADYNMQDVLLLEKVYLKLLPWTNNHPNVSQLEGRPDGCPKCGHHKLMSRGLKYTKSGSYQKLRCANCKGYCRARASNDSQPKQRVVNL